MKYYNIILKFIYDNNDHKKLNLNKNDQYNFIKSKITNIIEDLTYYQFVYDVSKQLSVFVGLIITNCIIMGRLEAFALANKPWASALDGLGNGIGYGVILVVVAFFKELFGSGTLLGFEIFGSQGKTLAESTGLYSMGYENNGMMLLPPSSLVLVAIYIWIQKSRNPSLQEAH